MYTDELHVHRRCNTTVHICKHFILQCLHRLEYEGSLYKHMMSYHMLVVVLSASTLKRQGSSLNCNSQRLETLFHVYISIS